MTLLINIGLCLLARICRLIFSIVGFIYGLFVNPKGTSDKLREMSMSDDRYCGVVASELLSDTMLTKESKHKFGDGRQTVSGYLGQNQISGTLTKAGKWLVDKLNLIDKNHAVDAIGWRKKE